MNEKRIASMDVLRIVLTIFVITLHFNNSMGGRAFIYTTNINYELALIFESFSLCAVNVFLILSGYFLCNRKDRDIIKIILLMGMTMGYGVFFYLIKNILTHSVTIGGIVRSLIPINYFVWLYCGVYVISPWINKMINNLRKKDFERLIVVLFIMFSLWPTVVDFYTSVSGTTIAEISFISANDNEAGYTIVQFIFAYCLGAYLKKYKLNFQKKFCFTGYVISFAVIYIFLHFSKSVMNYNNIFVILSAVFLTAYFQKIEIVSSQIINILAAQAFAVYIIHTKLYEVWSAIPLKDLLNKNLMITFIVYVVSIMMMYIVSVCIAIIFSKLLSPVKKIIKKRVNLTYRIE